MSGVREGLGGLGSSGATGMKRLACLAAVALGLLVLLVLPTAMNYINPGHVGIVIHQVGGGGSRATASW
jgi:hypothetical protein